MTDLGFSVPKQTYLGIKKGALGSKPGTIELEYVFLRAPQDQKEFKVQRLKGENYWCIMFCHLTHAVYSYA